MSGEAEISLDEIQIRINSAIQFLNQNNYSTSTSITAIELVAYFEGEAPSGDTTTISTVLESQWLLIHEIVELIELKTKGFKISSQLLFSQPSEVFSAHLVATEWELSLAFKAQDYSWVKLWLANVKDWLLDSTLTPKQIQSCQTILSKCTQKLLDHKEKI